MKSLLILKNPSFRKVLWYKALAAKRVFQASAPTCLFCCCNSSVGIIIVNCQKQDTDLSGPLA